MEAGDAEGGMHGVEEREETEWACGVLDAMVHVRPAAEAVLNSFREMNTPDEISLEFGVEFSAKLGAAVFASTEGEATFKVILKWKNTRGAQKSEVPVSRNSIAVHA